MAAVIVLDSGRSLSFSVDFLSCRLMSPVYPVLSIFIVDMIRQNLVFVLYHIVGSRTITPPDNYPGQLPPGQLPPRTNTPRTITPQITEFPKHKSTKFTSHKVYKSQSLQVTKSTQITGTKSQYIRVQILQNTSKYKGSAWLWQTLVIWWLLKKPFWGGIKPKTPKTFFAVQL